MAENHAGQEVLLLQELRKSYNVGKPTEVEVLHGLNLRLQRHDFAALVGASGSGKSTLLNVIGLLDKPTAGEMFLLGEPTRNMDDARRTKLRGSAIGFVFQFHHLIQAFSVLENVLMPLMVASGKPAREQLERARDLLSQVGLEGFDQRMPDQLSGGQQQRVAIARALASDAHVLLADEPTGNLDETTADEIIALLKKTAHELGKCVVVVTHSKHLAEEADEILEIKNGAISFLSE